MSAAQRIPLIGIIALADRFVADDEPASFLSVRIETSSETQ
jgi:hypothetical protein